MQRPQHRHRHHRRAVGVGHDALGDVGQVGRVDLRHDQRHERDPSAMPRSCRSRWRRQPPPAAPALGDRLAPLLNRPRSSPSKDVDSAPESSTAISAPSHGRMRPADRSDAKNRSDRTGKPRDRQQGPHHGTDLPGGAEDADGKPVVGEAGHHTAADSPKALCSATTASSTRSEPDDTRDPDRRCGDHLDVDVLLGQDLEHRWRPRQGWTSCRRR